MCTKTIPLQKCRSVRIRTIGALEEISTELRFHFNLFATMISALRHGPVGRTYEEDDEDEQAVQFIDPADSLELVISVEGLALSQLHSILFALDISAKPIADATISSFGLDEIGFVKGRVTKAQVASVFHSSSSNSVVVIVHGKLEDHIAPAFASLFDQFEARAIVIADTLSIANYVGQGGEGSLRKVVTSAVASHEVLDAAKVLSTPNLEIGNLVTGLTASLLGHAEARQVPAVAFVVLSKVFLSVKSMKSFESLAPLLKALHGAEKELSLPTNAVYNELLRRDPYVLRTENLYS